MQDKLKKLGSDWHVYEETGNADPSLPGIYVWTIAGEHGGVYVGKYKNLQRRLREYKRNLELLLGGGKYHIAGRDFRHIHYALANAIRQGRQIKLTLLENVTMEMLNTRERELILQMGTLNGKRFVNQAASNPESPTFLQVETATKMWSGRFREPLDPTFEAWQRSFPFDYRLLPQEIAASKAHARAIAAAGILTEAELAAMLSGLDQILAQTSMSTILEAGAEAEDIHHFVELALTREIGPLALKLHTGRSRNEQIATDMRLFVRDAIDATVAGLRNWREALVTIAEAAGEAAMPSYTHLQRAEPVLVAHWLLAYVSMAERDASRLTDARKRMNLCPLGSGAIAGATLALDRTIAARVLGFDAPTANSLDATSDRDFALDFLQALGTLGLHISRFAEELTLYSTAEFGFLDLPEAFSTGSSAMPQKKNPDLTELLRGKSGRLLGAATTLATILKGLPLAYNKDLQEGQEPVFDAADTIAGILSVLPAFTRALRFRFPAMKLAAETGYLNAMAAATYLSNKGVAFRKAHEIVGNAVRLGLETGRELNGLSLEELRTLSDAFAEDFFESITLEATLDCHDVIGGTARPRVAAALAEARANKT